MKKILCIILSLLIIPCSLLSLSACESKKTETATIRLCEVTHSIYYAPQYAAIELGFFAEEGLTIELTNAGGSDKVMTAVLSGGADIGLAGPESAIYVAAQGNENHPKIFAGLTACDGSFLLSREQISEFEWSAVIGKTIIPGRKGGVPRMMLEHSLRVNGIDPKTDVILDDSISFDLMAGAFTGGNADFVALFEPTATMVEQQNKGYIVASVGKTAGKAPCTAYYATPSYLEKNPDVLKKFVRAIKKAQKWIEENSAEEIAKVISPQFAETDLQTITAVVERYKTVGAFSKTTEITKESFDLLQDVIIEAGELEGKVEYEKLTNFVD